MRSVDGWGWERRGWSLLSWPDSLKSCREAATLRPIAGEEEGGGDGRCKSLKEDVEDVGESGRGEKGPAVDMERF